MRLTICCSLVILLGGCGRTGLADELGATAGPSEPRPPPPTSVQPLVLAGVPRAPTALASDEAFVYFVTSSAANDADRVARVPRSGGAVTELATRPARWGSPRSLARVGASLVIASSDTLYTVPVTGGAPRVLTPAAVLAGDRHVLASDGLVAVWLAADGALRLAREDAPGLAVSVLAAPPIPPDRANVATLAVSPHAVFVASSWANDLARWEGHVFRYAHSGALEASQTLVERPAAPSAMTLSGDRLSVAFDGRVDVLDASTLEPRGSFDFPGLSALVAHPDGGWLQLRWSSPDTFGGKLDGLRLVSVRGPPDVPVVIADSGHSSLGTALLVEANAAFWVRRDSPSGPGGVIERLPLE